MAIVKTDTKHYTNIANTIRAKTGRDDTYRPEEMVDGINELYSIGIEDGKAIYEDALSQSTDFYYFASGNSRNAFVPLLVNIDTSNASYFTCMFSYSTELETVPLFDTSNGTDLEGMFEDCSALVEVPPYNTSKCENFSRMFADCTRLKTIPQFDTSNGKDFASMLIGCKALKTVPQLDLGKADDTSYMFRHCDSLEELGVLNTQNVATIMNMFDSCMSLRKIGKFSFGIARTYSGVFTNCDALEEISIDGYLSRSVSFQDSPNLSVASMKDVIRHLTNYSGTTNASKYSVKFHADALARLSADEEPSPNGNSWTEYIIDLGWTY